MSNIKRFKRVFSFGILKHEIEGYGFRYSLKKYLFSVFLLLTIILITSFLYCLKIPYILFISIACLALVPIIIRLQFRYLYEQKRFHDVVVYLEQMAYSFQKQPKILIALKDTEKVTEGRMKELIQKAIIFIEDENSVNIYKYALGLVEEEYDCSRIKALHNFIIKVEEQGGNYTRYLNVLLMDFNRWTERTYLYQKDLKNIKKKASIAIIMSFFIASLSLFLKRYCNITTELLYQFMSSAFILGCTLFYAFMQFKINVSWLSPHKDEKVILHDYDRALYSDITKIRIKGVPFYLFFLFLSISFYFLKQPTIAGMIFFIDLVLPWVPNINKNNARKRTIAEIKNSFPEWLRNVAINLQFQTVQSAISSSCEDCPIVLNEAVKKMKDELEENPSAITPYYNFLKEFHLLDITSNVKSLYSMTESNKEEMVENIASLINRNYTMMDKNEKIHGEDKINTVSLLIYVPLVLACFKLIIDMTIFITVFMQNTNSVQINF